MVRAVRLLTVESVRVTRTLRMPLPVGVSALPEIVTSAAVGPKMVTAPEVVVTVAAFAAGSEALIGTGVLPN